MLAQLGTRTLAGAVVVAGVVTLTFLLVRLAPGDPVERLVGPTATPAQLAAQRRALGLDRPLAAQYALWLSRFARGDWGRSIATGRPVRALLGGAMRDVKNQPFVRTEEAKGLTPFQVTRRHVARNALIPVVTLLGLSLPALFSGAVFVEAVFAWPGVGRRLVEAVQARDCPVVMAAAAVTAALVVGGNLLTDLGVAWIDPRVRNEKREA